MRRDLQRFVRQAAGLALAFSMSLPMVACQGCSAKSELPSPLEERHLPARDLVKVQVPLGVTDTRQVLLLFGTKETSCEGWTPERAAQRFVVCVFAPAEQSEVLARSSLAELKKTYGTYVAPAPVLLVALDGRAELGRKLFLGEPAFFADVILYSPTIEPLTTTALFGFAQQGGRAFALVSPDDARIDRFYASLRSQPIHFERLPPGPEAQSRALAVVTGRPKGSEVPRKTPEPLAK